MTEKKDDKKGIDIDFGLGKINLGGIFDGIEKLVDAAAKLEQLGGEFKKEGEVDLSHLKQGMKGVFGVSVKTGIGGENPVVESFGNIKKTPEGPKVEEEREPLTDLFDENDEIVVIMEMPGVSKEDIQVDLNGDIFDVSASAKTRKYRKEILLPNAVKSEDMAWTFNNGIFEARMKKCP